MARLTIIPMPDARVATMPPAVRVEHEAGVSYFEATYQGGKSAARKIAGQSRQFAPYRGPRNQRAFVVEFERGFRS